ncbi:MAG TPA: DUF3649 domain-containing protein [Cellvibrio sp.]|nr:DUF3649 domain-containing protein [Cellvibrio sp.]
MSHAASTSDRLPRPQHWHLVARLLAALLGGYVLARACATLLTPLLPMPKSDALMTALLASGAIYTATMLWAFSVKSIDKAILGLLVPALLSGSLALVMKLSGAGAGL